MVAGAIIFLWLLVPPWFLDRRARYARAEEHARQGRANQRVGLDEILTELGQISSQLKHELRRGERGNLFPNTAWTKNQHLVTGETRSLVGATYDQLHILDQVALSSASGEMDSDETEKRQQMKQAVDVAAEEVRRLRDDLAT